MSQYSIVCGGENDPGAAADVEVIQLDVQGPSKNVNLRIEDLNKALLSNIPDVLLDLLEVAAYVYCADQRISRGSDKLTDHGRQWRRSLHFTIPLRQPDLWASDAVNNALCDTLGFLSDDAYTFDFVKATKPLAERSLYFPNLVEGTFVPDDIGLFSGGVDSFAGAVEDVIGNGKKMVLVGHHSATKVFSVQKELIDGLQKMGAARNIFYVSVNRPCLADLVTMPVGAVTALPAETLALLQEEADEALRAAKTVKDWLDGALALKYGSQADQARAVAGKDTGTVRFADGPVTIVADLPKRVEWDQSRLAALVERIRAEGDDPAEFVEISYKVSERKYGAWPGSIRSAFEAARTVRTGKPTFALQIGGGEGVR